MFTWGVPTDLAASNGERIAIGEVAQFLSHSLTDWIRNRPHLRVRFVVPINRDGDTVELHAWYDQVLFPDVSPMTKPEGGADSEPFASELVGRDLLELAQSGAV